MSPRPKPRPFDRSQSRQEPAKVQRELDLNLAKITPLAPTKQFLEAVAELGVELDAQDGPQLGRYLAMLLAANEQMNLTAVRDPDEAWLRHIMDSLTLLQALADLPEGASVIDVGSGGGLPGMPLAICSPHLKWTLLEATTKKVDFLRQAVTTLGLTNVRVVKARAESAAHDRGERGSAGRSGGHREQYDAVVARAVGPLNVLAEITVPFARVGGLLALIKGQRADEEVAFAKEALHTLKAVHETTIDTPTGRIVVLSKGAATPRTYPRADGEPKRVPLGGKMPSALPSEE